MKDHKSHTPESSQGCLSLQFRWETQARCALHVRPLFEQSADLQDPDCRAKDPSAAALEIGQSAAGHQKAASKLLNTILPTLSLLETVR